MSDISTTASDWLAEFLDSYPVVKGVAKPMTNREKSLVNYAFNEGRKWPIYSAHPSLDEALNSGDGSYKP